MGAWTWGVARAQLGALGPSGQGAAASLALLPPGCRDAAVFLVLLMQFLRQGS